MMMMMIRLHPLISRANFHTIPSRRSSTNDDNPSIDPRNRHIALRHRLQHSWLTIPEVQLHIIIPFGLITRSNHNPIRIPPVIALILHGPPIFLSRALHGVWRRLAVADVVPGRVWGLQQAGARALVGFVAVDVAVGFAWEVGDVAGKGWGEEVREGDGGPVGLAGGGDAIYGCG